MKGVPLRLEVGPRDIEQGQCVLVRRDNREKTVVKFEDLAATIPALLEDIQKSLFEKALRNREEHTYTAKSLDEMKDILKEHVGFVKSMWCGTARVRRRSRKRPACPAAACRLSRSIFRTYARCAASLRTRWLSGASPTKTRRP